MAIIYQNVEHLEGVSFKAKELAAFVIHGIGDGDLEDALKALKKGEKMFGTQVWSDALDLVRKEF
jgi:hypothetical protein